MMSSNVKVLPRVLLIVVWIVCPLFILLLPGVELAESFGRKVYDVSELRCAQAVLIVAAYFMAALVVFADRLRVGKIHLSRLTVFLAAVVSVHFVLVQWCWHYRYPFLNEGHSTFLYLWLIASFVLGMLVWWRIRVTELVSRPKESVLQSRFSIGSILMWLTLIGFLFSLFTQSSSLPVFIDSEVIVNPTIDQVVCAIGVVLLALPLTRWLIRTRLFFFVAAGVWAILFGLSWIVFCLMGLRESEYDPRDLWLVKITTFSVALVLYLAWTAVARFALRSSSDWQKPTAMRWNRARKIAFAAFSIASICLWGFLATWFAGNLLTFSGNRSLSQFDKSPLIMKELEEAYGKEAFERVRAEQDPQTLSEWVNCLGQERVPREINLQYQIASFTKFPYLDRVEGEGQYRRLLGFTDAQVASLPDETFEGWLRVNQTDPEIAATVTFKEDEKDPGKIDLFEFELQTAYAPWHESSMPLAARFCREKQAVFQRLRELVSKHNVSFLPRLKHGYLTGEDVSDFASRMLFADTRFALSKNDLSGALRNLKVIAEFANTLDDGNADLSFGKLRIRARAMDALIHIVETKSMAAADVATVRMVARELGDVSHSSKVEDINRFAFKMVQSRGNMSSSLSETNYLLLGREPLAALIFVHPQVIDWSGFISVSKDRFDRFQQLRNEIRGGKSQLAEILRFANEERKDEWQFHEQAAGLFDFPANRSKQIAESISDFEAAELRTLVLFAVRAKMRLVALELLLYRNEHGNFPDSLVKLKCDANDPLSDGFLIYRNTGERFELYSVGSNGIDDDGQEDRGDLVFLWPASSMEEYLE